MASGSVIIPITPLGGQSAVWECDDEASFLKRVVGAVNKDLGSLDTLPDSIGQLTALQTLDLNRCKALTSLESLAGLTALQTLTLDRCYALESLPPLAGLTALQTLNLYMCVALKSLPQLAGPTALQTLHLGNCFALKSLPELDGLAALQTLNLGGGKALETLPSLDGLTALKTLDLWGCESLKSLPSLDGLAALHTLDLRECKALTSLPPLDGLAALLTLDLGWCERLVSLPPLEGLTALETLNLRGCEALKSLPSLDGLAALQTLDLGCEALKSLPSLAGLTALQTLDLTGCWFLESLPPLAGLTALQTLDLWGCNSLKSLPSLDGLTALQTLKLEGCKTLTSLESLAGLTALSHLDLRECRVLTALPDIRDLGGLQTLNLARCEALQALPDFQFQSSIDYCTALQKLDLEGCTTLTKLQDSLATLPKSLRVLNLTECTLPYIPLSITRLTNLQELNVSKCDKLLSLPYGLDAMEKLEKLDLSSSAVNSLFLAKDSFPALKKLTLRSCDLKTLRLRDEHSFNLVKRDLCTLSVLETLDMSGLEDEFVLPDELGQLSSLKSLDLTGCTALVDLPMSIGKLTQVTLLDLRKCESLKELPETVIQLTALVTLDLSWCKSLKSLPGDPPKTDDVRGSPQDCGGGSPVGGDAWHTCHPLRWPRTKRQSASSAASELSTAARRCDKATQTTSGGATAQARHTATPVGSRGGVTCQPLRWLWTNPLSTSHDSSGIAPVPSTAARQCDKATQATIGDSCSPLGHLKALKTLDLSHTALRSLVFKDFYFKELKLAGCEKLKSLVLQGQNELERLDLSGCSVLDLLTETLPREETVKFNQLTALKHLNISGCSKILSARELPEGMKTLKEDVLHPDNDFSRYHMKIKDAKEDNNTASFVASVLAATGAAAMALASSCEGETMVTPEDGILSVTTVCSHHHVVKAFKFVWFLSTLFALVGLFATTRLSNVLSDTQNVYYASRVPFIVILIPELCVLCSTVLAYVGVVMVVQLFDFEVPYQVFAYMFFVALGLLGSFYARPKLLISGAVSFGWK